MTLFIRSLAIFLLSIPLAHAGPGISGGGKGVVCRDANRNVLSAETLDLWEAREIYGLQPELSEGTLRETVNKALLNLSHSIRTDEFTSTSSDGERISGAPVLYALMENNAYPFFKKDGDPSNVQIRWLRNVNLTPTNDAYDSATPANCAIEQIVAFGDTGLTTGKMLINQDLWDRLDQANQAALIVHEAFYKALRYFNGEISSLRVRRAVGLSFSGHKFGTLSDAELPTEHYKCERLTTGERANLPEDKTTRIFLLPIKDEATGKIRVALQASNIGGISVIGTPPQKVVRRDIPALDVERFDDLSSLVTKRMRYSFNLRGTVQEEMDPSMQFVKAAPRGKLKISVAAPPSVFFPEGLRRFELSCVYRAGH